MPKIGGIIAGGTSSIGQALQAVVVDTTLADHLGIVFVVADRADVVAKILADEIVGNCGVTLFEFEGQSCPLEFVG